METAQVAHIITLTQLQEFAAKNLDTVYNVNSITKCFCCKYVESLGYTNPCYNYDGENIFIHSSKDGKNEIFNVPKDFDTFTEGYHKRFPVRVLEITGRTIHDALVSNFST